MRIALTHNLRLSDSEEEAEFDTEETVNALAAAIERLGHRVEKMEVSGPASRTVARLEAFSPDLIFNTAEGRRGRFREAFFPALFEELGFPYTGSDAYALAVTLDKQLSKLVLRELGVRTPGWQFVEKVSELKADELHFPVIVKPNFEGSSKGITQDSVAETVEELRRKVIQALEKYPAGVLVEEFIVGRDLTVPFLEAVDNDFDGVLSPVEYVIDPAIAKGRRYSIYDYELKTTRDKAVSDLMRRDVTTVSPETPTVEALALMRRLRIGCLPVVHEDRLVGIMTEEDFMVVASKLLDQVQQVQQVQQVEPRT